MTRPQMAAPADPAMAQKWAVKAHLDSSTCKPCRDNAKKTYRNRQDAHKDYPGGRGYVDCVGAKYGNKCRCVVTKRGRKGRTNEMTPEQIAALSNRIRIQSETMSARAFAGAVEGPTEKLTMRAATQSDNGGAGPTQIFLYDYIGGWDGVKAADVAMMLAELTGPVDLHINSGGGSIFEGAAIYNAFVNYDKNKGEVHSFIDGVAASAASFIALAGRTVTQEATASMMVHDGQGGAVGTADMLRDTADLLDMLSNTIAAIYARKAGGTAAEWREVMQDGDTWYTAQAAKDAKLIDAIGNAAPAEPDDDPAPADGSNLLDLSLLAPVMTALPAATTHTDPATTPETRPAAVPADPFAALDFEGLRAALIGVHA